MAKIAEANANKDDNGDADDEDADANDDVDANVGNKDADANTEDVDAESKDANAKVDGDANVGVKDTDANAEDALAFFKGDGDGDVRFASRLSRSRPPGVPRSASCGDRGGHCCSSASLALPVPRQFPILYGDRETAATHEAPWDLNWRTGLGLVAV